MMPRLSVFRIVLAATGALAVCYNILYSPTMNGLLAVPSCRDPPASIIDLSPAAIARHPGTGLSSIKHLTKEAYEKYIQSPPGREHYPLLNYLTATYPSPPSCHVSDIGTRVAASAAALGQPGTRVWSFDRPGSDEIREAFRGRSRAEWEAAVQAANLDLTFYNVNLLTVEDSEFDRYMNTWLILLDTFHYPVTQPFEREFFARLTSRGFRGLLLLDDIILNAEMKDWWKELQDGAAEGGYVCYDLTKSGHMSGTGLLDFSGRVRVDGRAPMLRRSSS